MHHFDQLLAAIDEHGASAVKELLDGGNLHSAKSVMDLIWACAAIPRPGDPTDLAEAQRLLDEAQAAGSDCFLPISQTTAVIRRLRANADAFARLLG
jgi:hypothetical protein